jgi:hypothetical protein
MLEFRQLLKGANGTFFIAQFTHLSICTRLIIYSGSQQEITKIPIHPAIGIKAIYFKPRFHLEINSK